MHILHLISSLLISQALAAPSVAVAPSVNSLEIREDITTRNDLLDGDCRQVTVIFARGTIEPGNVGLLVGPPFFDALDDQLGDGNVAVQGVDYPASIGGYLEGGDPDGASQLANLTNIARQKCPDSKIILSGYSQGAQVVHLGAAQLDSGTLSSITGVVLFGDPDDGQAIAGIPTAKIDTICFYADFICDGLPIVDISHLSYGFTADQAAQFVAGLL